MLRGMAMGLALAALPALGGEPAITPAADRIMWCASAFYWLAGSAADAAEEAEAELYDGWAARLGGEGAALLQGLGFDESEVAAIIAAYDQKVLNEFGADAPRYDVAACPELVE